MDKLVMADYVPAYRVFSRTFCLFLLHSLPWLQEDSEGYPQLDIDDVLKIDVEQREDKLKVHST